uniref:PHD finger protein 10 n=1 Tax=Erpetoichthys calabaricus TaxID=27687 RepID=A0A8C4RPN7_ERPCA
RRMGSGDSSRSCDASSQDLGYFPTKILKEYLWVIFQLNCNSSINSFIFEYTKLVLNKLSKNAFLVCDEVIDLMIKEYPVKHAEYSVILQERERMRIAKEYSQMQQQAPQKVELSRVPEYIKKAAKKAAEFNINFNRERMEERRAYFDLQTHVIQVPRGKFKVLSPERTKTGPYPVALIPGQFQTYYKRYSPNELRYLPLNTALYEPPLDPELLALDSDGDSDDAEEGHGDENKKNKGNTVKSRQYTPGLAHIHVNC